MAHKIAFSTTIPLTRWKTQTFQASSYRPPGFPICVKSVTSAVLPSARPENSPSPSSSGLNGVSPITPVSRIVLICGFETFNLAVYNAASSAAATGAIAVFVFTDEQLQRQDSALVEALHSADVIFCSLIFDYDQVEWLNGQIPSHATVFVFESALELMARTKVGSFNMQFSSKSSGIPNGIKILLRKLGLAGREEDKLSGYLSLLKNAPRFLKLIPGRKARDLRNWLTVYAYWNAGGVENIISMFVYITREVLERDHLGDISAVVQIPNIGLLHPEYDGYFDHPGQYIEWYDKRYPERTEWPRVGILLYRKHVISKLPYIKEFIEMMEKAHILPLPVFITGVEAHIIVRDYLTSESKELARQRGERLFGSYKRGKTASVDAVVSTIGFPLVGGPAGSMAGGRNQQVGQVILQELNVPYIVAAPLLIQDVKSWFEKGVAGLQSVVLYSLPELDGAIDTVCIGGLAGEEIRLIPERMNRLTGRLKKWIMLRKKRNADKRVAIVLYGFPPSVGAVGTAALLNVPYSIQRILDRLKKEGYNIADGDKFSPEQLLNMIKENDEVMQGGARSSSSARQLLQTTTTVAATALKNWLSARNIDRIEKSWNKELDSSENIKTIEKRFLLGGLLLGNVWIGVQPPLGIVGDPMRMMFERDLTPHPQYAAFYRWLENGYKADAVIHVGTHGTYEWLPGNPLGNTEDSWSDIFVGNVPNLYIYAMNNPSESSLAKRRGYATIISHNVPPYARSSLYGQLEDLKNLVWEFNEAAQASKGDDVLKEIGNKIEEKVISSGLNVDLGFDPCTTPILSYVAQVSNYIKTLESRLFSSGLHVFGRPPDPDEAFGYVDAILSEYEDDLPPEEREGVARAIVAAKVKIPDDGLCSEWMRVDLQKYDKIEAVRAAQAIVEKLLETEKELDNLIRGLNGEFIEALPGGDVLRDGIGVLPTGSNIHALDPYRLPSKVAYLTGRAIAERVIDSYRKKNSNQYPETVAVPLWGLDNIKTKGESVGIALGLIGAEPILDGTGRVVRFGLVPLEQLGRPRIDVLLNLSGIFRDSFEHIVFLLDDLCRRAAEADEDITRNYIKKHSLDMKKEGDMFDSGARLFSNPAGDYGSMVNEQVADSTWETGEDLASTYISRNAYVYGRSSNGRRDDGTLKRILSTTDRVVQQIDSVEYGLSDIQEYYANTGALLRAAQIESGNEDVGASIVESFGSARDGGKGREPKELEQVLRMELRTRLLNPKWAEKMLKNGAGGAFEVSTRMTALIGWGGTAKFGDDFVFEQAAERYVLDQKNRDILRNSSPEAYRNILSRFIEAAGRGIWENPDDNLLKKLRSELEEVDAEIEGV